MIYNVKTYNNSYLVNVVEMYDKQFPATYSRKLFEVFDRDLDFEYSTSGKLRYLSFSSKYILNLVQYGNLSFFAIDKSPFDYNLLIEFTDKLFDQIVNRHIVSVEIVLKHHSKPVVSSDGDMIAIELSYSCHNAEANDSISFFVERDYNEIF